jgi:hypothetical protein
MSKTTFSLSLWVRFCSPGIRLLVNSDGELLDFHIGRNNSPAGFWERDGKLERPSEEAPQPFQVEEPLAEVEEEQMPGFYEQNYFLPVTMGEILLSRYQAVGKLLFLLDFLIGRNNSPAGFWERDRKLERPSEEAPQIRTASTVSSL